MEMHSLVSLFGDTFNASDSKSVCSTDKSRDSPVELNDINIISHNSSKRNTDDQLKIIREEKHKEYLHNAGCKSLSLKNNKNNEKSKPSNNLQDRNLNKNQPQETNNKSLWPSGTCVIVGDSMINSIDEKGLSKKYGNNKVVHFPGAKIEDINQYIIIIIKKQPDYLFPHIGTNHATTNTSKKIVNNLLILKSSSKLQNCIVKINHLT